MSVVALHEALVGDYRQSMLLLLGAVVVVLATALANLVSLALVRANGRRAELSMRMALGASRLHLARQLTVEALLLALDRERPRLAARGPGDRSGDAVGAAVDAPPGRSEP